MSLERRPLRNHLLVLPLLALIWPGCAWLGTKEISPHLLQTPGSPHEQGSRAIILIDSPDQVATSDQPASIGLRPQSPLSLTDCIDHAIKAHPDLAAVAAQRDSAQGALLQAGLYPNPMIGYDSDEMNSPDGGAGMQGIMLSQTFVRGGKLGLASAAASRGVEVADYQAQAKLYDVVTKVRIAYYETLAAQLELEATQEVLRIAQSGVETAEKLKQAGVVGQPDVLRAQLEREQGKIRVSMSRQRAQASWRMLGLAMGISELTPGPMLGALHEPVPEYDLDQIKAATLEVSAEVMAARASIQQAESQLTRAQAEVIPDVQVQIRPFYNSPDRRAELGVAINSPLPILNRNQGNILMARAAITQAHAALEQVKLQLGERMTLAFQRYQNARQQVDVYEKQILPAAQESLRLVMIAYGQGDPRNDFTTVLEAQRTLAQAKLGLVQSRGDLQKAVGEIEGLMQRLPARSATLSK